MMMGRDMRSEEKEMGRMRVERGGQGKGKLQKGKRRAMGR
jgi:hypothetical protein